MSRRRTAVLLIALFATGLGVALCGLGTIVLLDVDEPRFAAASRTMARGGDLIVPYFNGEERFDKPVLIYWVQALAMQMSPSMELTARLPSAVSVAATGPLVAAIALQLGVGLWLAVLAGLMVVTCAQSQIMAHAATADALLLLCTTIVAHGQIRRFVRGSSAGSFFQVWLGLAAAFLTKGPAALVAPGALAAGLVLAGARPRPTALLGGMVLFLVPVLAWGVPALVRTEGRFWTVGVLHHVVERSVRPFEGHGGYAPWWYLFYVASVPLTFLPWSLLLPAAVPVLRGRASLPVAATGRVLAAWIGGTVLVFTAVTSKLPHYPLPAFPALAIAIAAGIGKRGLEERTLRWIGWATIVLGAAAAVGLPVAFAAIGLPNVVVPAAVCGLVLGTGFVTCGAFARRGDTLGTLGMLSATSVMGFGLLAMFVLPSFGAVTLGEAAAQRLPRAVPPGKNVHVFGLVLPSLTFYLDRRVARVHGQEGASDAARALELIASPDDVVLVRGSRAGELRDAIRELDARQPALARKLGEALSTPLAEVDGYLPAKGKHERLLLLDVTDR